MKHCSAHKILASVVYLATKFQGASQSTNDQHPHTSPHDFQHPRWESTRAYNHPRRETSHTKRKHRTNRAKLRIRSLLKSRDWHTCCNCPSRLPNRRVPSKLSWLPKRKLGRLGINKHKKNRTPRPYQPKRVRTHWFGKMLHLPLQLYVFHPVSFLLLVVFSRVLEKAQKADGIYVLRTGTGADQSTNQGSKAGQEEATKGGTQSATNTTCSTPTSPVRKGRCATSEEGQAKKVGFVRCLNVWLYLGIFDRVIPTRTLARRQGGC